MWEWGMAEKYGGTGIAEQVGRGRMRNQPTNSSRFRRYRKYVLGTILGRAIQDGNKLDSIG